MSVKVYDLDSDTPMRVRYVVARSEYDALQARVAKLEAALEIIAHMYVMPEDKINRVTLVAAIVIAGDATRAAVEPDAP